MLVLGRRVGEGIMIGHDVKVTVLVVAGDKVRIGIDAPPEIEVHREEVYLEIQQANLLGPVVVNRRTRVAAQVVQYQSNYRAAEPLAPPGA